MHRNNMKTYFSDIIPKIQRFSQKLDNITLLTNQHWVFIDDIERTKNVYIFRQNGVLLISQNGKVEKANWEYLGNRSLLIDRKDESYLFKHGFFDENILALKIDSKDEYALFVNESKYDKELNSFLGVVEFLRCKYLNTANNGAYPVVARKAATRHIAPKYQLQRISENTNIFGASTIKSKVLFEDGTSGEVYLKSKTRQAYFEEKGSFSLKNQHVYKNIESCVVGLHYFLITGSIYKKGFEITLT